MRNFLFILAILVFSGFVSSAVDIPRPEYPRPQFERSDWINLNGEWTYVFDFGKSGHQRGFTESKGFDDKILVPFCPESSLSGVEHKGYIEMMWYHRKINVPGSWKDKKVLLHFGAVDYECEVFIDGKSAGIHYGGTSSFNFDITRLVRLGEEQELVLYVKDELRSGDQPRGKQSRKYQSAGIMYTRTTGIWQTVWMEPVSVNGLLNCFVIPDLDQERFIFQPRFHGLESGQKLRISIMDNGKQVASKEIIAADGITCQVPLKKPKTWSPQDPFLYDVVFQVITAEGTIADEVKSYAGMRKVHVEGNKVYLNNNPIYLRLVLDQGFYPGGVWTAPNDADLKRDIELSMNAGFNGARLHQKVFEERFHYWADKLGYLTWGESSSFGMNVNGEVAARNFLSEWEEIVERDRNHPSIITWTPFNETSARTDGRQHDRLVTDVYDLTKNIDPTRPINDASGYVHVKTDIWSVHIYLQDTVKFKEALTPTDEKGVFRSSAAAEVEPEYSGQPYIVDEYGGLKWIVGKRFSEESWGYGEEVQTEEEFFKRLEALTDAILSFDHIVGYCYTQLTDVEQEQNGIYNYDRSEKFDSAKIYKIFSKTKKLE
jgi:beta-galactosidase/beta-glucuronidase